MEGRDDDTMEVPLDQWHLQTIIIIWSLSEPNERSRVAAEDAAGEVVSFGDHSLRDDSTEADHGQKGEAAAAGLSAEEYEYHVGMMNAMEDGVDEEEGELQRRLNEMGQGQPIFQDAAMRIDDDEDSTVDDNNCPQTSTPWYMPSFWSNSRDTTASPTAAGEVVSVVSVDDHSLRDDSTEADHGQKGEAAAAGLSAEE